MIRDFKNIIFDLGGVLFDIDYDRTNEAFRNAGISKAETIFSRASQVKLFDDLEKGNITEEEFFSGIRAMSNHEITDNQIRDCWNALLIGLPEENVKLLRELKRDHRLFLLSNTNSIHEKAYREMIIKQYGHFIFDDIFEKMYLSHHLHMRKPDAEIFLHVLNDKKLNISETCFIDDSPQHVEGAKKVNLTSFLFKEKSEFNLTI